MSEYKSEGKCLYCNETYSKAGMSRHLVSHLQQLQQESPSSKKAFLLKVSAEEMFLYLLVDGAATLQDIDLFLRSIWLECCGHMSSFSLKRKNYHFDWEVEEFGEKKNTKTSAIFAKGVEFWYEYDFGSTTRLDIKVINEFNLKVGKKIVLLSRNEPLAIMCHKCKKKPASSLCTACFHKRNFIFCESCKQKHEKSCDDFADYSEMPIVNSPRMGVCGYTGGMIDQDRDGIWKG